MVTAMRTNPTVVEGNCVGTGMGVWLGVWLGVALIAVVCTFTGVG